MMTFFPLSRFCYIFLLLALVVGSFTPASAQTLRESLVKAYLKSPQLRAERAALRALDEGVSQANATWRPTITATGSYSFVESNSNTYAKPLNKVKSDTEPMQGSVSINQGLFQGFSGVHGVSQAKAQVHAGREGLRLVEQQVLFQTVSSYMDVLQAQSVVRLNEKNMQVLKKYRQAANVRFQVGESTRTNVAQAESRLATARAQLAGASAQLVQARSAFQRMTGELPKALSSPKINLLLPLDREEALKIAYRLSPVLAIARHTERSSHYAVRKSKGALLPSVALSGSYSRGKRLTSLYKNEVSTVAATVSVPIFQGGVAYSKVRQAQEFNNRDKMLVYQAMRETREAVLVAWENLYSARARVAAAREAVRASSIALKGVREEEKVGARTFLDVLDAERESLDAQVSLVGSQRDESVAAYSLIMAMGGLSPAALKLPVDDYDAQAQGRKVWGRWLGFSKPLPEDTKELESHEIPGKKDIESPEGSGKKR